MYKLTAVFICDSVTGQLLCLVENLLVVVFCCRLLARLRLFMVSFLLFQIWISVRDHSGFE